MCAAVAAVAAIAAAVAAAAAAAAAYILQECRAAVAVRLSAGRGEWRADVPAAAAALAVIPSR